MSEFPLLPPMIYTLEPLGWMAWRLYGKPVITPEQQNCWERERTGDVCLWWGSLVTICSQFSSPCVCVCMIVASSVAFVCGCVNEAYWLQLHLYRIDSNLYWFPIKNSSHQVYSITDTDQPWTRHGCLHNGYYLHHGNKWKILNRGFFVGSVLWRSRSGLSAPLVPSAIWFINSEGLFLSQKKKAPSRSIPNSSEIWSTSTFYWGGRKAWRVQSIPQLGWIL